MPLIDLATNSPGTFPNAEDDVFEFKISTTTPNELKKKLDRAVSAFANSGGGCFIYGFDDSGNADGGVATKIGKQDLRDWLDQVVSRVTPTPEYEICIYDDCEGRGILTTGNVIAAIAIHPSDVGPHQSSDHKYYIRAGAHTVAAGHHIVEALWARRHVQKPVLTHILRDKPSASDIIQIGVVAVTDAPALEVEFTITPLNGLLKNYAKYFPIQLPIVDRDNPFFLDVSMMHKADEELGDDVKVEIAYKDYAGNNYIHTNAVPLQRAIRPLRIGTEAQTKIARALERLVTPLETIAKKR
ncbi:MAG: hypothetical protein CME32_13070 [Gimesia sp.]|nr:hypothetical protein [Gimesia sp.]